MTSSKIEMENNIKNYSKEIITLEDFVEAVRLNFGMYIGYGGNKGFINMIREIFQNSIDELMKDASPCTEIIVSYDERNHNVIIEDNGRGIPFNDMVRIYTSQHTSSNYNKKDGEFSSGKHGVGGKVTNALSDSFIVESYILGEAMRLEFVDGKPSSKGMYAIPNNNNKQGSIIMFHPTYEIMGKITTTAQDVLDLINLILPLTKIGAVIYFNAIRLDGSEVHERLVNEDGIILDLINKTVNPLIKPIIAAKTTGKMKAEIAFTYDSNDLMTENITSYSNFCPMKGGTHVDGFTDALCRFFRDYMNKIYLSNSKNKKLTIVNNDIKTGLKAIVTVSHLYPIFTGQAKETLGNEDMFYFVRNLMTETLEQWSKENSTELQRLCKYLKDIAEIRVKSDEGKIRLRDQYQSSILTGLPKKYVKPNGRDNLELIIVEGDSAAGSIRNTRCKERQGVFPIRGKIPNAFTTPKTKFISNEEISGMIAIIGGGYWKSFDITKVRWKKILMSCFTGDTYVKMLDGTIKTFEELAEMERQNPGQDYWVYSYDENTGNYVAGCAHNPSIKEYTNKMCYLTLDNGHVIKCTPDHEFLTKDRGRVQAQNLIYGESLIPLYTKLDSDDREWIYDNKWKRTHQWVIDQFEQDPGIGYDVHHKDINKRNNIPLNLEYMVENDHMQLHWEDFIEAARSEVGRECSRESMIAYNKSQDHRDRISELHEQGFYPDVKKRLIIYNESQEHKDRIKQLHSEGYYDPVKNLMVYNLSEANRESTIELNKNNDMKKLQWQGRLCKMGATLLKDGLQLTPDLLGCNYNDIKSKGYVLYSYDVILTWFDSFDDFIKASNEYLSILTEDDYKSYKQRDIEALSAASIKSKQTMIVKVLKYMLDQNQLIFTQKLYDEAKRIVSPKAPTYNKIEKYFNSDEEIYEAIRNYNHKVLSVNIVDTKEPIPMYCLTVDKYHNFAVGDPGINHDADGSYIIVKNCDADPDGSHIRALLLRFFIMYMPELITSGKVFSAVPPLYGLKMGKKYRYFTEKMDFVRFTQKEFSKNNQIYTLNNKPMTVNEIVDLLFSNIDYVYEMEVISNRYSINPNLLELIMINKDKNANELKKILKSNFRFINLTMEKNTIVIKGLIESKYQTVFLSEKLLNDSKNIIDLIKKNMYMFYKINNEIRSLYDLMKLFESSTPPNITRFKGLGEMNPQQLADSTLHPDSDRTLIQYTIDDVKSEIETIQYLESNKGELIKDIKVARSDIF